MNSLLSLALAASLTSSWAFSQSISEFRIAQTGPDVDEYFELSGTPGQSLTGYTYIVVGDSGTNVGLIEEAVDLTGQVIPADGYFLAAESTFTLGTADLVTTLNFEDGGNVTHALVFGFTGNVGDDLDTNDDGVLESEPWSQLSNCITVWNNLTVNNYWSCGDAVFDLNDQIGHVYWCYDIFSYGGLDVSMGADSPGIFTPGCQSTFCDPANVNSSGSSVRIVPTMAAGSPSGIHLDASGGPNLQFGYFIVGTGVAATPISISQGLLCLDFSGSNQVGRYNIANTAMNSIGIFDTVGNFQNLVGTSSTGGQGFDIPNLLPFGSIVPIQAGQTYYFQMWYRDQAAGMGVSNFSNGYPISF